MRHPFFSILMPTKNRSEILGESIESALQQSFGDFELIISDNDDSEEATTKVISRYDDRRIKHLRTSGTLPMHENWENAFNHASGDYVLVLEDKMRLVSNALEVLRHYLCLHPGTVISYSVKFATGSTIPTPKLFPAAHQQDSKEVIERFCQFSQSFFDMVPKGLDSCAPRELLKRAQAASPTGFLFSYICPDYSYGFLLLSQVDSFLHIREPLIFVPNNWMWQGRYSNGQSSYKKDSHIRRFLSELPVKMEDVLKLVPIKSECLWINSVVFDFSTKYKRRGHQPQINWIAYHGFCIILVLLGKKIGGDMRLEIAEIKLALKHHDLSFQGRVALDVLRRGFALGWQALKGQIKQIAGS